MQDAVKRSILERFPIVGGESQWPMPAQGSTNNQTLPASFQLLAKLNFSHTRERISRAARPTPYSRLKR